METLARPHQGRFLLGMGILSIPATMFAVPLGMWVWYRSTQELAGMSAGVIDPDGRDFARLARVLAIISTVLWLMAVMMLVVTLSVPSELHAGRIQQVR